MYATSPTFEDFLCGTIYVFEDKDYPRDRNVLNSVSAGNRIFINQRNTSRGRCNRNVYHTSLLLFMMTVHSRNKAR